MTGSKEKLEEILKDLARRRDEISLKLHLGKAEAKEEWEKLEKKWQAAKAQSKTLAGVVGESAQNVASALELTLGELKKGYERVKKMLK
jgi:biopolymer transport protein ExbB/TolQ